MSDSPSQDWIKFKWWQFRVCLIGWRWHRIWVWNCLYESEWREAYKDGNTPRDEYIEGWCRE